jgi:hypothetical protein
MQTAESAASAWSQPRHDNELAGGFRIADMSPRIWRLMHGRRACGLFPNMRIQEFPNWF